MARTILLIESDPDLRGFWAGVFQREGFKTLFAQDEAEGCDQVRAGSPDMIFLGSNMEGIKGVRLMTQLKSERGDLMVVAPLNTSSLRQRLQEAKDQGAASPQIEVERMTYAIKEALGLREASLFGDLSITQMERQMIEAALKRAEGNQTQAARLLGISRFALRNRLKKYGLAAQGGPAERDFSGQRLQGGPALRDISGQKLQGSNKRSQLLIEQRERALG